MGNLNCFPADQTPPEENGVGEKTNTADILGTKVEKSDEDMADLLQVDNLIKNLKKKQQEHQNVLALCQELHMSNEELKAKLKNTEQDLHDKETSLEDTKKINQVHQLDAEVYKAQLDEATNQLQQMELLQKQLADIMKERNDLHERNRKLEQQVVDAITLSSPSKPGSSIVSTGDENMTDDNTNTVGETDSDRKSDLAAGKEKAPVAPISKSDPAKASTEPEPAKEVTIDTTDDPPARRERLDTIDNLTVDHSIDSSQTAQGETPKEAQQETPKEAGSGADAATENVDLTRKASMESHHAHLEEHLDEFGLD